MIKIIETYSHKTAADIEISYEENIYKNGIGILSYVPKTLPGFRIYTIPYKTAREVEEKILKAKLELIKSNENTVLLIIKGANNKLAILRGIEANLYSIKVNGIPFFQYNKEIKIDKKLLDKMNLIYNMTLKIDRAGFDALSMTIDSIIKSYKNTATVSKEDLLWLNEIYNKYKRLGDLYE
jgi:plasmid maintenance system killer protein